MKAKTFIISLIVLLSLYTIPLNASNLWVLTGHFIPGGHALGLTNPNTKVMVDGRSVFVNRDGWFVIGFSPEHVLQYKLKLIGEDGEQTDEIIKLKQRKYRSTRINKLPKKMVTPKSQNLIRIKKEIKLMNEIRSRSPTISDSLLKKWRQPVKGRVTGRYGDMRVFNDIVTSQHFGQDLATSIGKTVVAANDGIVVLAKNLFLSGNTIAIDHGHGLLSSYLHLNSISVQVGQYIKSGDKIGAVGATGRVTGAHLDWRISWFNVRLDPTLFIKPRYTYPGFVNKN